MHLHAVFSLIVEFFVGMKAKIMHKVIEYIMRCTLPPIPTHI
jgi:hypothetical protein